MNPSGTGNSLARISHLDAFRGIAATMVVASHCLQVVDVDKTWNTLRIALGHFPVLFFFVLSGYVLSRPLIRSQIDTRFYLAYLIKRFFRLVPLLVLVFLSAFAAAQWIDPGNLAGLDFSQAAINLTTWMSQVTTPSQLWQNMLLIQRGLNVPTWTIKIELVCSAVLPILVFIASKNRSLMLMLVIGFCFFGGQYFTKLFGLGGSDMTIFESFRYTYLFLFGFLLCRIDSFFSDCRKNLALIVLTLLGGALVLTLWVPVGDDLASGILIAGIMAVLIPLPFVHIKKFLNSRLAVLLGELSYGIYLFHTPVLLLVIAGPVEPWFWGLEGTARFPILFLQVFVLTLLLSSLAYCFAERPLNRTGHFLARLISPRDRLKRVEDHIPEISLP